VVNFVGFGVPAVLGRTILPADDDPDANPSWYQHRYWQRRFGGSPEVLGKSIKLNDSSFVIVGVTPLSFSAPES
jgi:hypothetical protein